MSKIPTPEELAKKNWVIQGFNSSLNYIMHGPLSSIVYQHDELGYGYTEQLFIFDKDYLDYYYLEEDFVSVGKTFLERFESDFSYAAEVRKISDDLTDKEYEIISNLKDPVDYNDDDLFVVFHDIATSYTKPIGAGHVIEGISYVIEPYLKEKLASFLKMKENDKSFREIITKLLEPNRPSWVSEEFIELLELAKFAKKEGFSDVVLEKIENHRKIFYYNQLNYYHADGLEVDDYKKEIQKIINDDIDKWIEDEKERYVSNNKVRLEIIKSYKIPNDLQRLISLVVDTLHWQDTRKKDMLSAIYYLDKFTKEISKRFHISLNILKTLSWSEITLENIKNLDIDLYKKRLEGFAVYFYNNNGKLGEKFYVGDEFKDFLKRYSKGVEKQDHIHGNCACMGKAQGKVRICRNVDDIKKFEEGEVLVAMMTRPEFVPAMKKAAAIITDEGGITSHAAIISRELGKPCVIGAKIATKTLNNGDLVEVNANHGIVKRIK